VNLSAKNLASVAKLFQSHCDEDLGKKLKLSIIEQFRIGETNEFSVIYEKNEKLCKVGDDGTFSVR